MSPSWWTAELQEDLESALAGNSAAECCALCRFWDSSTGYIGVCESGHQVTTDDDHCWVWRPRCGGEHADED